MLNIKYDDLFYNKYVHKGFNKITPQQILLGQPACFIRRIKASKLARFTVTN